MTKPPNEAGLDAMLGFRRIDCVRVLISENDARAEAVGMTHRVSRTLPITLLLAHRLIERGVPVVVRRVADVGTASEASASRRRAHPAGEARRKWLHLHSAAPSSIGA